MINTSSWTTFFHRWPQQVLEVTVAFYETLLAQHNLRQNWTYKVGEARDGFNRCWKLPSKSHKKQKQRNFLLHKKYLNFHMKKTNRLKCNFSREQTKPACCVCAFWFEFIVFKSNYSPHKILLILILLSLVFIWLQIFP